MEHFLPAVLSQFLFLLFDRKVLKKGSMHNRNDGLSRRVFLREATAGALAAMIVGVSHGVEVSEEDAKILAALPAKAPAKPQRPRKLLIFNLNVGYGGHSSISVAQAAFTAMGRKTGAFETVVSSDPEVFRRSSLQQFDAVFLNNTVGNLFTDQELRRDLLEFVYAGGGLIGVHGTSAAFLCWDGSNKDDWPEFGVMLGMRGAAHRAADEQVFMKVEDPTHPVTSCFNGQSFAMTDEFFRPMGTYSRDRSRVLLSFDLDKTDLRNEPHDGCYREDKDYAMAWVRSYGRGRIFFSTFGHQHATFHDPRLLPFYLAGTQFALGDLPASTIPSGKLTPALRAQEKLGWRLGVEAYTFHKGTFFETIEKAAALGVAFVGALSFQKVSSEIPKDLAPGLSDDELRAIRLKLDASGMRLLTYFLQDIPDDEAGCRAVFEFGRKLGIETFMSEPKVEALPLIDRFCLEYGIKVALHNHDRKASPHYWSPEAILQACQGLSPMIGACVDTGYWMREGIDPIKGVETLKERIITLQLHDLHTLGSDGQDVPWGTGKGRMEEFFQRLRELNISPVMFGLEYSRDFTDNLAAVRQCAEFFNKVSIRLGDNT